MSAAATAAAEAHDDASRPASIGFATEVLVQVHVCAADMPLAAFTAPTIVLELDHDDASWPDAICIWPYRPPP